jgi:hypothetical protein
VADDVALTNFFENFSERSLFISKLKAFQYFINKFGAQHQLGEKEKVA